MRLKEKLCVCVYNNFELFTGVKFLSFSVSRLEGAALHPSLYPLLFTLLPATNDKIKQDE